MDQRAKRPRQARMRDRHTPAQPVSQIDGAAGSGVEALQRSAGNAAVRSLLQRDDEVAGGTSLLSMRRPAQPGGATGGLPSLVPRLTPSQMQEIFAEEERKQDEVRPRITAWLDRERHAVVEQGLQGTISMPELVARIRSEVEGARDVQLVWIETLVKQHLGAAAPPATRRTVSQSGVLAEIAAIIANIAGLHVKVGTDAASLRIGITGVATAKAKVGPVEAGVEADVKKGVGVEAVKGKAKVGPVAVEASAKDVGLEIEFPFVAGSKGKFKSTISYKGDWQLGISLPLVGSKPIAAHPTAEAIGKAVREAEAAARGIVVLLNEGDEPDGEAIKELGTKVGSALKVIGKVAKAPEGKGPRLTLELGVQGGQRELPQPGGESVRMPEVKGGVNLILRF